MSPDDGGEPREPQRQLVDERTAGDRTTHTFGDHRVDDRVDAVGSGGVQVDHEGIGRDCREVHTELIDLAAEPPVVAHDKVGVGGECAGSSR